MARSLRVMAAQSAIAFGVVASAHALTPDLSLAGSVNYRAVAFGATDIDHRYSLRLSAPTSFNAHIASFGFDELRFVVELSLPTGGWIKGYDVMSNSFDTGPEYLPAGDLLARVVGTGVAPASAYNLTMYALPVPEPSQWLLMGAGLMIVAFIAKRRPTAS